VKSKEHALAVADALAAPAEAERNRQIESRPTWESIEA
jgi:hypothetical protein